jgi:hypothetical protein
MLKKLLLAALPMVVSNAFALEPQQWAAIEPAVRAALECRQPLSVDKLKNITPDSSGSWTLTPPAAFSVFGLPVTRVEIFIDPDGELGASYTAVIEKHSLQKVEQQLKAAGSKARIGELSAGQAHGPHQVEVSCVVAEGE